jgi:hypothetical protein
MITKSKNTQDPMPGSVVSDMQRIFGLESGDPRSCTSFQTRLGFSKLMKDAKRIEDIGCLVKGEETGRIERMLEDFRAFCGNAVRCPLIEKCDVCIDEGLKKQVD